MNQKQFNLSREDIAKIISGDTELMISKAEEYGKLFEENNLTTSQIRNIFGTVKKIEMWSKQWDKKKEDILRELILLKPKLAYAAGRQKGNEGVEQFKDVTVVAIDEVQKNKNKESVLNFCKFFEAILAYHRAAGGR